MEKKVELLAPAGSIQCFYAAMNAGADAVYLGGERFGARAYADNFNKEQLLEAIDYAHLFQKKVYLTCNTLLKEEELYQALEYVSPFYEAGLDGVIIQDFGALRLFKRHFPGLELHASTQMTITGKEGAYLLKKYGVQRIVPARELSLEELKDIKDNVDVELEIFIHGAMCYAYSGQCLFSSMLGGRSGNRGRCAGPCRLPYDAFYEGKQVNRQKEQYLLSLKDLCAVSLLPKLIEAGMDSFKIEGRMKSAEYVAGVTSIYRKYIDIYYENREKSKNTFAVEKEDMEHLKKLYVRSGLETGYFEKHHGSSLVTLEKPCYQTGSAEELQSITAPYLKEPAKILIKGRIVLIEGKPAQFFVQTEEKQGGKNVTVIGGTVQTAANRPVDEEAVKKQLQKTGGTAFAFQSIQVIIEGNCFISIKELNDLRRQALEKLSKELLKPFSRNSVKLLDKPLADKGNEWKVPLGENYHIVVSDYEQLEAVAEFLLEQDKEQEESLPVKKLSVPAELLSERNIFPILNVLKERNLELSLSFPGIVRMNTLKNIEKYLSDKQETTLFSSFLTGNLELLSYFKQNYPDKELYGDVSLYCFNEEGLEFLREQGIAGICMPYEWSRHEIALMLKKNPSFSGECIVYGYIPLMESAGCILKTTGNGSYCKKGERLAYLRDRYKKKLPVVLHCDRCENTIYNSVPYSLHKELDTLKEMGIFRFRLNFTIETKEQVLKCLQFFRKKEKSQQPFREFTKGHFGKGVE